MRYSTRVFRYLNDCNVVKVCLMKSSEVTTTVSGRKKESSNEVVHAEYEKKLTWWPWRTRGILVLAVIFCFV